MSMRHTYGSTEKTLRRNRKTWTRLANKRGRALDKDAIEEEALARELEKKTATKATRYRKRRAH